MPLPKKTVRVLPNPWAHVHHELGPQGLCHRDTGGRGSDPAFIGAELDPTKTKVTESREAQDPRNHRQITVFRFPALNAALTGPSEAGGGIELPKTPYYLDRLRDGDLVPADAATAGNVPCRFKSLAEARAAGIAKFEADYGADAFTARCDDAENEDSEFKSFKGLGSATKSSGSKHAAPAASVIDDAKPSAKGADK